MEGLRNLQILHWRKWEFLVFYWIACIKSGTFGVIVHRFFPRVSFSFKSRTISWEMKVNSQRSLFYCFHIKPQLGTLLLALLLLLLRQIKIIVMIMSVDIWCEHMKYAYLYSRLKQFFTCMILAVFSFFLSSSESGLKNPDMHGTRTLTIAMLVQCWCSASAPPVEISVQ